MRFYKLLLEESTRKNVSSYRVNHACPHMIHVRVHKLNLQVMIKNFPMATKEMDASIMYIGPIQLMEQCDKLALL